MNELIFLTLIIISILTVFCLNKLYTKRGLYFSLVTMSLITFIFSFKIITVFTVNINLSIVTMISIFTIIYILIFKYGKKEMKSILKLSTYTNIITASLIYLTNHYIPAVTESITISIEGSFIYNYKILILYPIIMLLSEFLAIHLFNYIKILSNNIYINTILVYIITGLLYTVIFYLIIYIDILPVNNTIFLGIATFLVGLLITGINEVLIKIINPRLEVKL